MKIILVDGLVGNEYASCLAEGLTSIGADVTMIVPENRIISVPVNCEVKYWLSSKGPNGNIIKKSLTYLISQFRIINYVIRNKNCVIHYQFFRRKEDVFFIRCLSFLIINLYSS